MKMSSVAIAAGMALALPVLNAAHAAEAAYPTKPIRLIAPFPAGGTSDTIARTLGQKLTEAWKQGVVVDNRGGVGGIVGTTMAARAPADGYTLLANTAPLVANPPPHGLMSDLSPSMRSLLYGISLGAAFFGESMFSVERDASKIALVHLVERLRAGGYTLLDLKAGHQWQLGRTTVKAEVSVLNALDKRYIAVIDVGDVQSGTIGYYPGAPRTALATLTIQY